MFAVIREHEEGRAIRFQTAVELHTVRNRRHRVFTNTEMDISARRIACGIVTVDIPNSLLQKPYKITAYVCIYEGATFKSLYSIVIPVKARNKPNDYTLIDDEEVYSFNALENSVKALENALNQKLDKDGEIVTYNSASNAFFTKDNKSLIICVSRSISLVISPMNS